MSEWDVSKPSELKRLLLTHHFAFKKQLGQNFLIDARILDEIADAAEVSDQDGVFEIGPGAGVVTQRMAARAKKVVAVEKDTSLSGVLTSSLAGFDNVEVIYADVLKLDMENVWRAFDGCCRVSMVANLPYYITTPILFHVLESHVQVNNIVVMVQREVAERLSAEPGGKEYGALSVAVQYRAQVDKVTKVSPGAFLPPPSVDSMVVRLRCRPSPPVTLLNEQVFFKVVRAAFAMRRKTLLNTLSGQLGLAKDQCRALLNEVGIDPVRRGETLSIEEFAAVSNAYVERQKSV